MKENMAPFIRPERLKQLLMTVIFMLNLDQSTLPLYQTYRNLLKRVWFRLLIQLQYALVVFQIINPYVLPAISKYQQNWTIQKRFN